MNEYLLAVRVPTEAWAYIWTAIILTVAALSGLVIYSAWLWVRRKFKMEEVRRIVYFNVPKDEVQTLIDALKVSNPKGSGAKVSYDQAKSDDPEFLHGLARRICCRIHDETCISWHLVSVEESEEIVAIIADELSHRGLEPHGDCHQRFVSLCETIRGWWEEHKFDTTGDYGERNVYDGEPKFVTLAKDVIGDWECQANAGGQHER